MFYYGDYQQEVRMPSDFITDPRVCAYLALEGHRLTYESWLAGGEHGQTAPLRKYCDSVRDTAGLDCAELLDDVSNGIAAGLDEAACVREALSQVVEELEEHICPLPVP